MKGLAIFVVVMCSTVSWANEDKTAQTITQLNIQLNQKTELINALIEEKSTLAKELPLVRQERTQLLQTVESLNKKIQQTNDLMIANKQKQILLDNQEAQLKELATANKDLTAQLEKVSKDYTSCDQARGKFQDVSTKLNTCQDERQSIQKQLEATHAQLKTINQDSLKTQEQVKKFADQSVRLQQERDALQKKLEEAQQQFNKLNSDYAKLEQWADSKDKAFNELKESVAQYQQVIETFKEQNQRLLTDKTQAQEMINNLNEQLKTLQQTQMPVDDLKDQYKKALSDVVQLKVEKAQLQQRLESVPEDSSSAPVVSNTEK